MVHASKFQNTKPHTLEQLTRYFLPEQSTLINFGGGMFIGIFGQPFSNWKRACQHAPKGTTSQEICNRIMAPRHIKDLVTDRIIAHGGGIRHFWDALPLGMLGSTVKQGVKGTALVKIDNTPIPPYIKALISAVIITGVITPFDRFSNALVSSNNKHLSKLEVIKAVYKGGLPSIYKGARTNIAKDLTEASLIYLIRYFFKDQKNDHQLTTPLEKAKTALFSKMALFTTISKLIITQPLDGIKADLQQGLEHGKPTTVLTVIQRQGLYKLFTAGLGARFILNYLSISVTLFGMHVNDLLKEQKKLDG